MRADHRRRHAGSLEALRVARPEAVASGWSDAPGNVQTLGLALVFPADRQRGGEDGLRDEPQPEPAELAADRCHGVPAALACLESPEDILRISVETPQFAALAVCLLLGLLPLLRLLPPLAD